MLVQSCRLGASVPRDHAPDVDTARIVRILESEEDALIHTRGGGQDRDSSGAARGDRGVAPVLAPHAMLQDLGQGRLGHLGVSRGLHLCAMPVEPNLDPLNILEAGDLGTLGLGAGVEGRVLDEALDQRRRVRLQVVHQRGQAVPVLSSGAIALCGLRIERKP